MLCCLGGNSRQREGSISQKAKYTVFSETIYSDAHNDRLHWGGVSLSVKDSVEAGSSGQMGHCPPPQTQSALSLQFRFVSLLLLSLIVAVVELCRQNKNYLTLPPPIVCLFLFKAFLYHLLFVSISKWCWPFCLPPNQPH